MPKKGENIYKRKDGRWEGRYVKGRSPNGKLLFGYVYGKTYVEAKTKREEILAQNIFAPVEPLTQEELQSFRIIAWRWFETITPNVKKSTANKYQNILNSYISEQILNTPIYKISHETLQEHCNYLLTNGGKQQQGLAPKTVSDILSVIREVINYATRHGIKNSCNIEAIKIKQSVSEMRILTLNEQKMLCQELYSELENGNVGILISLFAGLRIGEICALQWEDISFINKTLHVQHTMQRIQTDENKGKKTSVILTTPKSACSIRTIPLPDNLLQTLEKYKKTENGYVLTNSAKVFMEPRSLQNQYKRVLKKCGIEDTNYHTLRHTFATRCVELGFDTKSLSEILGHATVNITMNRYVHPSMELKKENMQRLSELLAVNRNSQILENG